MRLFVEDTAAVFIDFQEKLVPAIKDNAELVKRAAVFAKGLREIGIPIAVTQQYTKGLGETVPEMKEALGDFSPIEKTSFSALGSEGFAEWLKAQGKSTLLICGAEAHICVLQTILDLAQGGFRVFIVADCVGSRKDTDKDYGVDRAVQEGAYVTTCEAALFELVRGAGTPHFKAISNLVK